MKLDKKIEETIKQEVLRLLKCGKPNWDIPHTNTTVKWIRKLIKLEGGNEKVLVPAAYFHDTGYKALKANYSHKEMMEAKPGHAELGAINAKNFLSELNYFEDEEINRIIYLIANHDKHNNIQENDRQLLFEADGLAQINFDDCHPNYDKKNLIEFFETYYKKRKQFMKTKTGLEAMNKLEKKAKYYLK